MKKMLISLLLIVMSVFTLAEQTKFDKQREINELVQTGIYYYWNGGDLKKDENEFLCTLDGIEINRIKEEYIFINFSSIKEDCLKK